MLNAKKCTAKWKQHHTWFVNLVVRKPWNTYSIIFFAQHFCDHYSFKREKKKKIREAHTQRARCTETDETNSRASQWVWLKRLLSINGNNHNFGEKDVSVSCHGHKHFHADQIYHFFFQIEHTKRTQMRHFSHSIAHKYNITFYWCFFCVCFYFF